MLIIKNIMPSFSVQVPESNHKLTGGTIVLSFMKT